LELGLGLVRQQSTAGMPHWCRRSPRLPNPPSARPAAPPVQQALSTAHSRLPPGSGRWVEVRGRGRGGVRARGTGQG
jgi:hypothetical protein